MLLGLIADGRGLAFMSASLRQVKRRGVVFRPFETNVPLTMGVVLVHAPDNESPFLKPFLNMTQSLAGQEQTHTEEAAAARAHRRSGDQARRSGSAE